MLCLNGCHLICTEYEFTLLHAGDDGEDEEKKKGFFFMINHRDNYDANEA